MSDVHLPGGAKAVIHVHQANMRQGKPALIVRRRGKSKHFRRITIFGPSMLEQTLLPDACGARAKIVTHADVVGSTEETA